MRVLFRVAAALLIAVPVLAVLVVLVALSLSRQSAPRYRARLSPETAASSRVRLRASAVVGDRRNTDSADSYPAGQRSSTFCRRARRPGLCDV